MVKSGVLCHPCEEGFVLLLYTLPVVTSIPLLNE